MRKFCSGLRNTRQPTISVLGKFYKKGSCLAGTGAAIENLQGWKFYKGQLLNVHIGNNDVFRIIIAES